MQPWMAKRLITTQKRLSKTFLIEGALKGSRGATFDNLDQVACTERSSHDLLR